MSNVKCSRQYNVTIGFVIRVIVCVRNVNKPLQPIELKLNRETLPLIEAFRIHNGSTYVLQRHQCKLCEKRSYNARKDLYRHIRKEHPSQGRFVAFYCHASIIYSFSFQQS